MTMDKNAVLTEINGILGEYEDIMGLVLDMLTSFDYEIEEGDTFLLAFDCEKVVNRIKNSCNVSEIPDGLIQTAVSMIVGEFLYAKKQNGKLPDVEQAVKQVQLGDTNVTFADKSKTPEERLDSLISYLINSGEGDFVCYRKIKW